METITTKHITDSIDKMLKTSGLEKYPVDMTDEVVEKRRLMDFQPTDSALHRRYSREYPGRVFVPTSIWNKILKKYGLIQGDFDDYNHEIPARILDSLYEFMGYNTRWKVRSNWNGSWSGRFKLVDVTKEQAEAYVAEHKGYFNLNRLQVTQESVYMYPYNITAPIEHFNLKKNKKLKGNRIISLDPIVTKRVNGGYIIVEAWDVEASIPEIQNPLSN